MNDSKADLSTEPGPARGLSRRTMIAATAWSVPAIIVATSAPAMATSPGVVSFTGEACKHPGNSDNPFDQDYHFVILIKNTTGAAVTVTLTDAQLNGVPRFFSVGEGELPVDSADKDIIVPSSAGATGITYIIHLDGDNSANTSVTLFYTYGGVTGQSTGVPSESPCEYPPFINNTPPVKDVYP